MELRPKVIAIYTSPRKRDVDCVWYPEIVETSMFQKIKVVHHDLMMRFDPENTPQIAVLIQIDRIAFLICNLSGNESNRRLDHYNRLIKHSLYLEFDSADRQAVLSGVAALLHDDEIYRNYVERFYLYADKQYEPVALQHKLPILECIDWPENGDSTKNIQKMKIELLKIAVPLNAATQQEYADYLIQFAQLEQIEREFLLVSTGRVKLQEIEEYAIKNISEEHQLVVLTLSSSVPDKQKLANTAIPQRAVTPQRVQTVGQQAGQAVMRVTQTGQKMIQKIFPAANQPVQTAVTPSEPQTKEQSDDSKEKTVEEADKAEHQQKVDEKSPNVTKAIVIVAPLILLVIGIFFFTHDRTPPQLASLTFQAPDTALIASSGESLTIPRVGDKGAFFLTFKKPVNPKNAPRLSISKGQEWVTPQSCKMEADEKIWNCPVTISPDNPNQPAAFTLTIADGKDHAGNRMAAVNVNLSLSSANISVDLIDPPTFAWRDLLTWRDVIVEVKAEQGVKEVQINNFTAAPIPHNRWQTEIPTYPTLDDQEPLTITIIDTYGNKVTQLF